MTKDHMNRTENQKLDAFGRGDGAHCGLTDWYPDKEKALRKAIASGNPFTTGWYSSKKEIASAKISRDESGSITVEASVSDDFDTPGSGRESFTPKTKNVDQILNTIRKLIYSAWDTAEKDQKENRIYTGFKVLANERVFSTYIGGKPVGKGTICPAWVETYIRNDTGIDHPPGDDYYKWGWQLDGARISRADREKLEAWALSWAPGKAKSFTVGKWTIQPWGEE